MVCELLEVGLIEVDDAVAFFKGALPESLQANCALVLFEFGVYEEKE
jgi:hypothetical protein